MFLPSLKKIAHKQSYNCAQTLTNIKTDMGAYCLFKYVCDLMNEKAPLKYRTEYKCLIQAGNNTPAHRHNTGGFGTPMLVLLLSIFPTKKKKSRLQDRTDP